MTAPAAPALQLRSLNVALRTREGYLGAVHELTVGVRAGECLGVVGESGAGKSQAFLAALGLAPPHARVSGAIELEGRAIAASDVRSLRAVRGARIAMVFQDPMSSLTPHLRVGDQIAEVLVRHRSHSWRAAREHARSLLERVHVPEAGRRVRQYPHELSGGMRQRVMIALALACDPAVLIADEPTTSLDVTIQVQILGVLQELKRTGALALVLISHDLGVIAGMADRVAVMHGGRLIEQGSAEEIFRAPQHPQTQLLLRHARPGLPLGARGARASTAAPLLRLEQLRVQYALPARGALVRAVEDVSLELRPGEALGLVGESGSGKSTLARAVLMLVRAASGRVLWMGRPLAELKAAELRRSRRDLQIIFQDPLASLDPRLTVAQAIAEPLELHRADLDREARTRAVLDMLARVGLSAAHAGRYPHELSGGQCQRVGIARAMILEPRLLVCDEPLSSLDVSVQAQIVSLISALRTASGTAILFVSHNLSIVRQLCDRVLVMYLGRALEIAPSAELFVRPLHPYTRALMAAIPIPDPQLQPARLERALQGELPTGSPPSGCVFRTRCAHALAVCASTVPGLERAAEEHSIACHRWQELAPEAAPAG